MSDILSAELAATCSSLGYFDITSNKYFIDSNTLETVKDLIRYLRRDDENHDIRRQLGDTKVLETDLIPMLKSYWEETELFDVVLRLLVNLTSPASMLWNDQIPTERTTRTHYMQIDDHLKNYKAVFVNSDVWSVLSRRLSKTLEIDYAERGEENSLIIERILILIRNILYIPIDPEYQRPDNDANLHDQVLWALRESGMLDLILFICSSPTEKAYYLHVLEIFSLMLREQKASELAKAELQRTDIEKLKDEAELLSILHRENLQKQQKVKAFTGARHSRFGGTYVVKSMKSIGDNDLIYHKPLNKIDALNFDAHKKKPKTPKNRLPVSNKTLTRKSALSIRLFLKEFCIEFLNGAYNSFMYHINRTLTGGNGQDSDETYYLWAIRFFMEVNRCYKFDIKLVSETVSFQMFHYIQQQMEKYFDMIGSDKKNAKLWSRRLHVGLLAYKELLLTILAMEKSQDQSVKDSSKIIQGNIFYVPDYRELVVSLLNNYDELKSSDLYLKDLLETQHIFIKMFEQFCGKQGSVIVKKKLKTNKKKKKVNKDPKIAPVDLEKLWDEASPQLSALLEAGGDFTTDIIPFDATSEVPIDEQRTEAMKIIQRKLRQSEFENAVGLLHACRDIWPDGSFGTSTISQYEEFQILQDIFLADIDDASTPEMVAEDPEKSDEDEEEEEYQDRSKVMESEFKFIDFVRRFCHPKVVRACGLALKNFENNSVFTNHCIVKLLHRISIDCKMHVMLLQLSLFRTFQQIYKMKELPQYKELMKFASYIIKKFLEVSQKNKKIYMEMLFWKNSREAFEIEEGYGTYQSNSKVKTWTEENEDELRRLFMEHREKQIEEDIVDWITENLIDHTRTRRAVLKKLKELMLITDYKSNPSRKGPKVVKHWEQEDEEQLRELFSEFKESGDPVGDILPRLEKRRTKNMVIEKLLSMGLIQDKKEVRKKRVKKSQNSNLHRRSEESDMSESDDNVSRGNSPILTKQNKTNRKNSINRNKQRKFIKSSRTDIVKLTLSIADEFSEAFEWLRDSLSDAVEDLESSTDLDEGIPLVPIMESAVDAMEKASFQKLLSALGIMKPFDEQEIYWRIPISLGVDVLNEYVDLLTQAIQKTLQPLSECTDDTFDNLTISENLDNGDLEENATNVQGEENSSDFKETINDYAFNFEDQRSGEILLNKKRSRIVANADSDSEDESNAEPGPSNINKQSEAESENQQSIKFNSKRLRIIDSDDEED